MGKHARKYLLALAGGVAVIIGAIYLSPIPDSLGLTEQGRLTGSVRDQLKDPGSAKFRNLKVIEGAGILCGEVNAKNAFGAYVGFRKFAFNKPTGELEFLDEEKSNAIDLGTMLLCRSEWGMSLF